MSQNSFTVLGSSSGLPQADRACSAYLLKTGDSLSLIDCGGGATSSFLRCGFDPGKLDKVFVSHTHSDHCCELTLVIQMLHVLGSTRRLDIYVPDEFVRPLLAYLNAVYMFPQHVTPALHIQGYGDGFVYHGDGFELEAIANQHLEKASELIEQYDVPNRMQSHSFRIATTDTNLLYSADLAGFEDIASYLHDLDYALVESTHVELGRLLEHARASSVGQYVLTHLGDGEETEAIQNRIAAAGLTNVSLAFDGLTLPM
jgi:ribonuclease BN (tRNA processing enzyme)